MVKSGEFPVARSFICFCKLYSTPAEITPKQLLFTISYNNSRLFYALQSVVQLSLKLCGVKFTLLFGSDLLELNFPLQNFSVSVCVSCVFILSVKRFFFRVWFKCKVVYTVQRKVGVKSFERRKKILSKVLSLRSNVSAWNRTENDVQSDCIYRTIGYLAFGCRALWRCTTHREIGATSSTASLPWWVL